MRLLLAAGVSLSLEQN